MTSPYCDNYFSVYQKEKLSTMFSSDFLISVTVLFLYSTESEVVPKVVEAILTVPPNTHVAVKHTSVLLLGELCEWIQKHPSTLDPVLNFLVCCLPQPGVGAAAAVALQNICANCGDCMPQHVPILLQLLHQVDTFAITNNAVIGLLKGIVSTSKDLVLKALNLSRRSNMSFQYCFLFSSIMNTNSTTLIFKPCLKFIMKPPQTIV